MRAASDRLKKRMINGDPITKNWLEIATLIVLIITAVATMVGPLLAVFVQARINQPKPSPVENQPKNRIQRMRRWLTRVIASRRTPYVSLLLNIIALLANLFSQSPITRLTVLAIAVGVAGVFFQLMYLLLSKVIDQLEHDGEIIGRILTVVEKLALMQRRLPDTQREEIGLIRSTLNKLLGK